MRTISTIYLAQLLLSSILQELYVEREHNVVTVSCPTVLDIIYLYYATSVFNVKFNNLIVNGFISSTIGFMLVEITFKSNFGTKEPKAFETIV